MRKFLVISLFILSCSLIYGQGKLFSYIPNPVMQGSDFNLSYNHLHPEARLKGNEDIYFRYTIIYENSFENESQIIKLEKQEDCFSGTFTIPENAMQLIGSFITFSSNSLDKANLDIEIHNIGGESIFKKYPAYVYRDKWFFYPFQFTEDTLKYVIENELEIVKKFENVDPLGTLYSMSYGYLLINEELKARKAIREMVKRYPEHQLTSQAINSYNYMVYSGKINSSEGAQEIRKLNYDMISRNPGKQYSRNFIRADDPTGIPTTVIEDICKVWFEVEPENPMPYLCLTARYYKYQINSDMIQELCTRGIDLIVNNKFRKYLDIGGKYSVRFISTFLYRRAWANYDNGNYSEALIDIKSARSFAEEEGSFPLLEAKIWLAVDNYTMAENALLEALKLGSSNADSILKDIYSVRNVQFKSYIDYLRSKLNITPSETPVIKNESQGDHFDHDYYETDSRFASGPCINENEFNGIINSEEENKSVLNDYTKLKESMISKAYSIEEQDLSDFAPDFDVITLEGKKISLKEIKNKIIVLNFWGLGCGPCLNEIPELNNIVDRYKNKNVEFIAFSGDSKKYLAEFVRKKEFKYNIIPEAKEQFRDYSISILPTHIIITPDGRIHNRIIGSGHERYKAIDKQISLLLILFEL